MSKTLSSFPFMSTSPTPLREALSKYRLAHPSQIMGLVHEGIDVSQSPTGKWLAYMLSKSDPQDVTPEMLSFVLTNGIHPSVLAMVLEKSGPEPLLEALQSVGDLYRTRASIDEVGKCVELAAKFHPSPCTKVCAKMTKAFKKAYKTKINSDDFSTYRQHKKMVVDEFVLQSTMLIHGSQRASPPRKSTRCKM